MPKEKNCKSCALCERLYRKFGYGIYSDDFYLCAVTEEFTDKESVCGHWQEKVQEYDISAERFNKAEEDIAAINRIFKEKKIPFLSFRTKRRRISI